MKLLTLKLENFQGIKKEEFKFDGHSASIYGDNATERRQYSTPYLASFDKASTEQRTTRRRQRDPMETFTT